MESLKLVHGQLPDDANAHQRCFIPPYWDCPSKYPSPSSENYRNWAWQFLRRNPQYAQDANRATRVPLEHLIRTRQPSDSEPIAHFVVTPNLTDAADVTVREFRNRCKSDGTECQVLTWREFLRRAWGINIPQPVQLPVSAHWPGDVQAPKLRFLSATAQLVGPVWISKKLSLDTAAVRRVRITVQAHEVWLRFNLNSALASQVRNAQERLEELQRDYARLSKLASDDAAIAPAAASLPRPLRSRGDRDGRDLVARRTLHYALRTYDAVHPLPGTTYKLDKPFLDRLRNRFVEEHESLYPNNPPHRIADWYTFPVVTNKQLQSWYAHACDYVHRFGYLRIAALKREHHDRE